MPLLSHQGLGFVRLCAPIAFLACVLMNSCGTGIEVTEHVTDKDVRKVIEQVDSKQATVSLETYVDSLALPTHLRVSTLCIATVKMSMLFVLVYRCPCSSTWTWWNMSPTRSRARTSTSALPSGTIGLASRCAMDDGISR